eukprot:3533745-Pyramimonas_sp.AAC.1
MRLYHTRLHTRKFFERYAEFWSGLAHNTRCWNSYMPQCKAHQTHQDRSRGEIKFCRNWNGRGQAPPSCTRRMVREWTGSHARKVISIMGYVYRNAGGFKSRAR